MINFDPITDHLFVGTCPSSQIDVQHLHQIGITAVVNLQSDSDLERLGIDWSALEKHYSEERIEAHRIDMTDFDEANIEARLREGAAVVNSALQAGHQVYLHCTAGRERSPTMAAAWLTLYRGESPDSALLLVTRARKSNPYAYMVRRLAES